MTSQSGSNLTSGALQAIEYSQSADHAAALKAMNLAREAISDAGHDVSVPGAAEAGEFYAQIDGVNLAIRVDIL